MIRAALRFRYWVISGHHASAGRSPLYAISRHDGPFASCPFFPPKRTFVSALSMSALCQKRTGRSLTDNWRFSEAIAGASKAKKGEVPLVGPRGRRAGADRSRA